MMFVKVLGFERDEGLCLEYVRFKKELRLQCSCKIHLIIYFLTLACHAGQRASSVRCRR